MTGPNGENDRPIRPLPLQDLNRELLQGVETSIFSEIAIARYEVQGDVTDLLIELGLKFPELFPAPGQTLPWEYGVFEGFPNSVVLEANYRVYRFKPAPDKYEVKFFLYYGDEFVEGDALDQSWHMQLGKASDRPGIFSSMTRHHLGDEARYNPVEVKTVEREDAEDDFSFIAHKYAGDYIERPPVVPEGLEGIDDYLDDFFDSDDD